jgi:hypothetical protein
MVKYITMRNIRSAFRFIVITLIMTSAAFLLPTKGLPQEWETILNITAFLFGILSGFAITILWTRLSDVRTNLIEENSYLESIFYLSSQYGHKILSDITELIDRYTISTVVNTLSDYDHSQDEFLNLYSYILHKLPNKKGEVDTVKDHMISAMNQIITTREKTLFFSRATLVTYMSGAIYALGIVLIAALFLNKTNSLTSIIITAMLSAVTMLVLVLISDLNKMRLWERLFLETNVNRAFDMLGRKRFYDPWILQQGLMRPKPGEVYRTVDTVDPVGAPKAAAEGRIIVKTWPKKDPLRFLYKKLL